MRLKIRHVTSYRFDTGAAMGLQQVRKYPKSGNGQLVHSWDTSIEGGKVELTFDDHHNNRVELLSFTRSTTELLVTSEGEVEVEDHSGVVGQHRAPSPLWLYTRPTPQTRAAASVRALLKGIYGDTPLQMLHSLSEHVAEAVSYEVGASAPDWTAEDALKAGKGVCQDHAHVFIAAARELGMPARYVSGYLMLNDRPDQDAMHAWAEAYVPDLGWVGFDPSNGISPDPRYVRVATGLDYRDASPIRGLRTGHGTEELRVDITVAEHAQ